MELYINDILVDIDKTVPFPLNYQIGDIKDVSKRKGNSSKTIALPGTQTNVNLFSSVFSLSTTGQQSTAGFSQPPIVYDFDPSVKAPARYYQNGILQFRGVCQLVDCVDNNGSWTFNIVLFSDTVDYFSELKNIKLKELDLSEYNHLYRRAEQQNSWNGIIKKNGVNYNNYSGSNWLGEGYYYGLIDYGHSRPSDDAFAVEHIYPQIFIKTLWDKMFDKIGVNYTSTFISSQTFKRCLMAYEGGNIPTIDSATATSYSVETDQDNSLGTKILDNDQTGIDYGYTGNYVVPSNGLISVAYDSVTASEVDPSSQIQQSAPFRFVTANEGSYKLTYQGDHDITQTWTLLNGSGSYNTDFGLLANIQVYKNGTLYTMENLYFDTVSNNALTRTATVSFTKEINLYLHTGDDVTVNVRFATSGANMNTLQDTGGYAGTASFNTSVVATNCELDLAYQTQSIVPNSTIDLRYFLPEMDCGTFFKGIVSMFNLYVKPDPDDKDTVIIEPLNDFYGGSNNAVNWTELVDRSKPRTITPTINEAPKEYIFKFKDDPDYWNTRYFNDVVEQYGSRVLESNSQFSEGQTKIELPFSNKLLGEIPNTNLVVPRNFQVKSGQNGTVQITERKGKPFIVQVLAGNPGTKETGTWTHIDEWAQGFPQVQYPYVGHVDDYNSPTFDLMFDVPDYVFYDLPSGINYTTNNLFQYHEKFVKEIMSKNGKMLTAYIMLTSDIVNTLDFGTLINIDGIIYRLQKIENYDSTSDKSTKCEFIKILDGESVQTTNSVPGNPDFYPQPADTILRATEDNDIRVLEDGTTQRRIEY